MTSQSPSDDALTPEYVRGWLAVNRLVREGGSWSGREANCAYLNLGSGAFADVSHVSGLDFLDDGRAFARVDWDHDGDLDLWVVNRTAPQVRFLRNNSPAGGNSLTIRLVATNGHPDAIGARVLVRLGERRLLRVRQAGSGYLSQSSSWLHFGTGDATSVDEVVVRWPDHTEQRLSGLAIGGRYVVTQGESDVETVDARREIVLESSRPEPLPVSEVTRLGLSWRVPFPRLSVTDFDGREHALGATGGPLLVNFWASWCASCRFELQTWNAERDALESAGLTIVALSVDEQSATARKAADALDCWFPMGMAPENLVVAGDVLQSVLVDRQRELAVPISFLIDGEGRLANIYKGPVTTEQLLADVADLPRRGLDAAASAVPFAGRWHTGPHFPALLEIANQLSERGAAELAGPYVAMADEALGAGGANASNTGGVAQALAHQGAQLTDAGHLDEGEAALRRSLALDDGQRGVWYALGQIAVQRGALGDAEASVRRALELDPEFAAGWNLLGIILDGLGRSDEALEALQHALTLDSELPGAWLALAIHHLTQGRPADGLPAFRRATELDPDNSMAWTGVGSCLLSAGDRTGGREALQRAVDLDPQNQRAVSLLATVD